MIGAARESDGWALIKNSDGIKLYERPVPPDLTEYMAVTQIDEKMEVIGEVLRDVRQYHLWMKDCFNAQIVKKYDRNTFIMYMVLTPIIIEKRDIVLKDQTIYDWDKARALITFNATNEIKIPIEENHVRVVIMEGSFDMEYLGRNKTKFVYRLKTDPAGYIPRKLAYSFMKTYPYDTLKNLKKMLPNEKYARAARGTEEEKAIESRIKNELYVGRVLSTRLSKFVKDKDALQALVAADRDGIRDIMNSGGSYASVEKITTNIFIKYIAGFIMDKSMVNMFENDKTFVAEITDMVISECGAWTPMIEDIAVRYLNKYSK